MIVSGTQNARPGATVAAVPYAAPGDTAQAGSAPRRPAPPHVRAHAAILHRSPGVCLGARHLITLGGVLALTRLPAEAYPEIAPPQLR